MDPDDYLFQNYEIEYEDDDLCSDSSTSDEDENRANVDPAFRAIQMAAQRTDPSILLQKMGNHPAVKLYRQNCPKPPPAVIENAPVYLEMKAEARLLR
jgi:hypothetical protein